MPTRTQSLKQKHLDAADKAVHDSERRNILLQQLEKSFVSLEQDVAALRQAAGSLPSQNASPEAGSTILSSHRSCCCLGRTPFCVACRDICV